MSSTRRRRPARQQPGESTRVRRALDEPVDLAQSHQQHEPDRLPDGGGQHGRGRRERLHAGLRAHVRLRALSEPGDLRLAASGTEPFRSGVNASFLRSPLRSGENVASMSQDGRFTVFLSVEDDLSADDDDRFINVYRRDNLTGETVLVSRADGPAGAAANGTSGTTGGGLLVRPGPRRRPLDLRGRQPDRVRERRDQPRRATTRTRCRTCSCAIVAAGTTTLASRDDADAVHPDCPVGRSRDQRRRDKVAFVTRFPGDRWTATTTPTSTCATSPRGRRSSSAGRARPGRPATTARARPRSTPTAATWRSRPPRRLLGDPRREPGPGRLGARRGGRAGLAGERDVAGNATGNDGSVAPAISADGNRVAFSSSRRTSSWRRLQRRHPGRVRARHGRGATSLVSRTAGANGISGNGGSERASIDASGTRIAFETFATDLVPGDLNGSHGRAVRDTVARHDGARRSRRRGSTAPRPPSGAGLRASPATATAWRSRRPGRVRGDAAGHRPPAGGRAGRCAAIARSARCPDRRRRPARPARPRLPDTTAPVLSGVSVAPRRFLPGRRVRPRTRKRPAIGARLRFTLSEAATVTIRIDALLPGRRLKKRCVAPRRAPRGRTCRRAVRRGTLTRVASAGANRVKLTGRLRGRRLPAGPYRATLRARDAAGNVSAPSRTRFTVLRPT